MVPRIREWMVAEGGSSTVEHVIFMAAVVMPLGALFFWLMRALLAWFAMMETFVSGPF